MEGPPLGALHCLPSHQLLLYADLLVAYDFTGYQWYTSSQLMGSPALMGREFVRMGRAMTRSWLCFLFNPLLTMTGLGMLGLTPPTLLIEGTSLNFLVSIIYIFLSKYTVNILPYNRIQKICSLFPTGCWHENMCTTDSWCLIFFAILQRIWKS